MLPNLLISCNSSLERIKYGNKGDNHGYKQVFYLHVRELIYKDGVTNIYQGFYETRADL